jgi:superfamily I DNA/RNA helicase
VSLNADQQLIVSDFQGARCVLAGPGTGKTTTMVQLVNELRNAGINDIRGVTFSKEAAQTVEKRSRSKGVFSTFHSLGYLIASETDRKPVEPEKRQRLMYRLKNKWGVDLKQLDMFIARMRRENVSPNDARESGAYEYEYAAAYAEYEHTRLNEGWMDFDSMLRDAVDILEKNPETLARWQTEHLIVDEAQDTDDLQWRLMQLMAQKHGNITIVGDPNQAIYGFRGAKPENITNFDQWFPGGRTFYLGRNYRSTKRIVQFIRENAPKGTPVELLKRMTAARDEEGAPIALKMYWTDEAEAESALKLAQADPLNSTILARTNRMVGLLERFCNRYGIRYHLLGKTGFWKQSEVRKAIEALKLYPNMTTVQACSIVFPALEAKYAVADRTERDNDALENLSSLRAQATRDFKMAREFVVYANKMVHRRNDPKGVTISTVHQAKGSEFKQVFVIGVKANGFPSKNGDPLEEQRIWFVAISRAVDYLRISFAGTPSPFLHRYITEEIHDRLRSKAEEVQHLEEQHKLF